MVRAPHRPPKPTVRAKAPIRPRAVPLARVPNVRLVEDPHAHVVCRVCGRIQRIELTELDRHLLTELAAQHPEGWSVDGVAFSLTGACQRCREGPAAH